MSKPSPKTVVITGCTTGGIGEALAKEFHSQGARVFATSRNVDAMPTLAAIGIETLALDVTDVNSIREAKTVIEERTGSSLDILVNNARVPDIFPWPSILITLN